MAIREENKSAEYRSRTQAAGQNTTDASSSNGLRQNSSNQAASQSWLNFCEKVKIPLTEKPLPCKNWLCKNDPNVKKADRQTDRLEIELLEDKPDRHVRERPSVIQIRQTA